MKGGLTPEQYLGVISKKIDEVRDAGITINDEELALFAMDDLDSSYDAFVTVITATAGDISFAEFKGLLRAHDARIARESARALLSANVAQFSGQLKPAAAASVTPPTPATYLAPS